MEVAFLKGSEVLTVVLFDDAATDADITSVMEGSPYDADSFKKLAYNESVNDAGEFIVNEKPVEFPSFIWHAQSKSWTPPVNKPEGDYRWDEATTAWVAV